eukprot:scaffold53724_cov36-Tisochrysis_lutea.AAC.1
MELRATERSASSGYWRESALAKLHAEYAMPVCRTAMDPEYVAWKLEMHNLECDRVEREGARQDKGRE